MNYEKLQRRLLSAVCLVTLSACSTMPGKTPLVQIDPPPVSLAQPCATPLDLVGDITVDQLINWTTEWMSAYRCERSKRAGLIRAWPK